MNDELERVRKEPLLPVDAVSRHLPAGPDENHKNPVRIADDETENKKAIYCIPLYHAFREKKLENCYTMKLISVAAPNKVWVCGHSLAGIVGSNPTGGMAVCLL
jgi:hypothetical protein